MRVKVNIREHLEGATDHNGELHVSANIDLEDFFEGNGIPEEEEIDVDIHELLAENRQIALIWSVEDVQQLRPDLNDDQAWEVLQHVDHHKDAELGITWLTLEMAADHLFGDAAETDESKEAKP
jgi:hypothetical protein